MDDIIIKVADLAPELVRAGQGEIYHLNPYMNFEPIEQPDNFGWYGFSHGDGDDPERAMVILNQARWGEYSNSSTTQRANYNALLEDFPESFVTIGHSGHDGMALALPLNGEVSEYLAEIIRSLDHSAYDDDAVTVVEQQIEQESWDGCVEFDLKREIEKFCDNMTECVSWELLDAMLDGEPENFLRDMFYDGVQSMEIYPVFETADSCYYPNFEGLAAYCAVRLSHHYINAMIRATAVAGQVALEVAL